MPAALKVQEAPHDVEFKTIKNLLKRLTANRRIQPEVVISVDNRDVPTWQRQTVWTADDFGLLANSIIRNYPIGMIVLWKKPNGIRVPIDGRQRLTAIMEFVAGRAAIPDLPQIPPEMRRRKYLLLDGDEERGYKQLTIEHMEAFEDYEPMIVQYDNVEERTAMDMFVKLQGGKTLTNSEVRAALGGALCDFVTELTTDRPAAEEDEEEETPSRDAFFREVNVRNSRKAHRNLCDVLLHEYLHPGQDKHWSSLEKMYIDYSTNLREPKKRGFRDELGRFRRACEVVTGGNKVLLPQLRSAFLILTVYRAWRQLGSDFASPSTFTFAEEIADFETMRVEHPKESPWVNFTAALSNAGYAKNRSDERHQILMSFLLQRHPAMKRKDRRRVFTEEQKIAIWDRADARCEWKDRMGHRCEATFPDFREADADHFVMWRDGGPTTLANGRLLCKTHNRGRRG